MVLFMGAYTRGEVNRNLGRLRVFIGSRFELRSKAGALHFVWITHFPLFEVDESTSRLTAVHHPFTQPSDEHLLDSKDKESLLNLHARSYDLVLNGQEVGRRQHSNSPARSAIAALRDYWSIQADRGGALWVFTSRSAFGSSTPRRLGAWDRPARFNFDKSTFNSRRHSVSKESGSTLSAHARAGSRWGTAAQGSPYRICEISQRREVIQ